MEKRIYEIALSLLTGIGPVKAKALVARLGDAEAVFKESSKALGLIPGIGSATLHTLNRKECLERAKQESDFLDSENIGYYYFQDAAYPQRLKFCEDGPVVLFTKGNVNFNRKNVAVVGTRRATTYGKKLTQDLIADLAHLDVQIVSGLAYGIDIEAHKAAMTKELPTLAVFGHGFDLIYPAAHKSVARAMLNKGGWVTEYVRYSNGDVSNFPRRNRIVAGLCDATIVVESGMSGGSLITASLANDYSRDVFAFPGNIEQEFSKGCNWLIQQNNAHLITGAADLIRVMNWDQPEKVRRIQPQLFPELSESEDKIVSVLRDKDIVHIDNLAAILSRSSASLSMDLFNLEMKGLVQFSPGKGYRVI